METPPSALRIPPAEPVHTHTHTRTQTRTYTHITHTRTHTHGHAQTLSGLFPSSLALKPVCGAARCVSARLCAGAELEKSPCHLNDFCMPWCSEHSGGMHNRRNGFAGALSAERSRHYLLARRRKGGKLSSALQGPTEGPRCCLLTLLPSPCAFCAASPPPGAARETSDFFCFFFLSCTSVLCVCGDSLLSVRPVATPVHFKGIIQTAAKAQRQTGNIGEKADPRARKYFSLVPLHLSPTKYREAHRKRALAL